MIQEKGLLGVINCLGPHYNKTILFYDLLFFSLGSIVVISLLLLYYNKIHKTNTNNLSDVSIYQSKDVLLQEKSVNGIYLVQEKTLSIWTKLIIYLFILIAITTPLYQLFGIQHFI